MKKMKIAVASGKGGVGKSMISSALCHRLAQRGKLIAADCDVDAPDLGIWLGVDEINLDIPISTSSKAFVDLEKCSGCGKCEEVCNFNAILRDEYGKPKIIPYLCEACGACEEFCPTRAIELRPVNNGRMGWTKTRFGFDLLTGQLLPGETCSGKIIAEMKKQLDEEQDYDCLLLDSAAGVGCPTVSAITGVDFVVMVTEPTPSGFSDLKRLDEIVGHFGLGSCVVINKWDLNEKISNEIEKWAGARLAGKISFDRGVFKALASMIPIFESDTLAARELDGILDRIEEVI
jgi:MinD superfamily P-loop ATPase